MTATSTYLNQPVRSEVDARRAIAVRNVREAAMRDGQDPEAAERGLRNAYALRDMLSAIGGRV